MKNIGKMTRSIRLATTAAALAGLASIASCGAAPTEVDETEITTSALTCSPACGTGKTCYATNVCAWTAGTIQNLQTALQNHQTEIVVLTADLNASSFSWHVPYFAGVLDGQGHTISNLTATDNPFVNSAGMIGRADFATIKNLKLTNLQSSGAYAAGGLVGSCDGCKIDSVAVEGTVNAPAYVGGVLGGMTAGTMTKTYFKGTVTGGDQGAGGLVGLAYDDGIDLATITNCYAQALNQTSTLVAGNTTAGIHPAGGLVGAGAGMSVSDVYAIGAVTGRGSSGGLIGQASCEASGFSWLLYKGIYRGNVTDSNLAWAGVVGQATDASCLGRIANLYWNSDLDRDTNALPSVGQRRSTGAELTWPTAPTAANGGIFCQSGNPNLPCGDNGMSDPPWDFGTSSQNNVLRNMPGPNAQIR